MPRIPIVFTLFDEISKEGDNIQNKATNHGTKIDVFLFILHLLFSGSPSAKLRQQSGPLRVRVETVVKKKRLQVILREPAECTLSLIHI